MLKAKEEKLKQNQRGAATILLSFFVMSILLMMALTAAGIMVYQIQMSREVSNSVPAFYAADATIEECLYQIRKQTLNDPLFGCTIVSGNYSINENLNNGAYGEAGLWDLTADSGQLRSYGKFGGTRRNIEISWESFVPSTPTPTPTPPCVPVDGGWSDWGEWGLCSESCGGGTQIAFRTCSDPFPLCGGLDCVGSNSQTQSCNTQPCPLAATGGTVTYAGGYTIHTFYSSGTFTVTGSGSAEVLVVAGGGGGAGHKGGGGGGGGVVYHSGKVLTAGSYSVTVGSGGGGGGGHADGNNGNDSSFWDIIANGGGGGSYENGSLHSGGSGGGTSLSNRQGAAPNQGNSGGGTGYGNYGGYNNGTGGHGSGGGGAGGEGGPAYDWPDRPGNGGPGRYFFSAYYAGGGGGGSGPSGSLGGIGGGGNGSGDGGNGFPGTPNTGGGGGGGGSELSGGSGGLGIVIVRYPTN